MLKGQKKGQKLWPPRTCVCGKSFYASPRILALGKGKFCSLVCKRANMTRRSGLVYILKVVNPTWFREGEKHPNSFTPPKGVRFNPAYEFKKGNIPGNFKGDAVGYMGLHSWVRRNLGKPKKCLHCKNTVGRLHWANISWEYKRDPDDWMPLCPKCHSKYDHSGGWGEGVKKFPSQLRRV